MVRVARRSIHTGSRPHATLRCIGAALKQQVRLFDLKAPSFHGWLACLGKACLDDSLIVGALVHQYPILILWLVPAEDLSRDFCVLVTYISRTSRCRIIDSGAVLCDIPCYRYHFGA